MKTALLATLFLLSGCASNPASEARKQQDERARMAAYGKKCQGFGFQPGTNAFASCVRDEHYCDQRRKEAAFNYNQALVREGSKRGSTYLQNSARAAREAGVTGACR